MEFFWFLGGFFAVLLGLFMIYRIVRRKFRQISSRLFGTHDLIQALKDVDTTTQETPRSLNGCDSILLPQILKDFPDFDIALAKTYAKNTLKDQLSGKRNIKVHNVVIAKYLRANVQKTIVMQAAVAYSDGSRTVQTRYELDYTYIVDGQSTTVAANCPNCGGVLSYGEVTCPFCESRVTNVLSATWKFTQIQEK